MGKKKITLNNLSTAIEDLARMVKEGFDDIGKRFEQVDKRFESVENRLTTLERGQEDIKLRLGQFAFNIDVLEIKRKMEILEKHCSAKKIIF